MGARIAQVSGTAVPLRGADIDTDRIVPARFLRCVTFDGLEEHAFEDDRDQLRERGETHPFDDDRFAGASILLVNKNFGCGSSREHAPQALIRWGVRAVVGESYSEIFYGNCVAIGLPCVTVDEEQAESLMAACEADPSTLLTVDLDGRRIVCGDREFALDIPEGTRWLFLEGRWDSTAELLEGRDAVEATARGLPYFGGWQT